MLAGKIIPGLKIDNAELFTQDKKFASFQLCVVRVTPQHEETLIGCRIEIHSEAQRQALRRLIMTHQHSTLH